MRWAASRRAKRRDDGRACRADDQGDDRPDGEEVVAIVDGEGAREANCADDGDAHSGHQAAEDEQGQVHLHIWRRCPAGLSFYREERSSASVYRLSTRGA